MGYGDELMGSGIARGAAARGKRIAFGDGKRILWRSPHAQEIFQGNPNVAPPGSEHSPDLEWVKHYTGHRLYARPNHGRWHWDFSFKATPGEVFLTGLERAAAMVMPAHAVLIEPAVKSSAANKQWARDRYAAVARRLIEAGRVVVQFDRSGPPLQPQVKIIRSQSFRHALACLERVDLYLGPEGGLHHGAAAVGTAAVVIFGGFISPALTGYTAHTNLYVGGQPCGTIGRPCPHCKAAMAAISVDTVTQAAFAQLEGKASKAAQLACL